MANFNKEHTKFSRFESIQRPSTTQKRFQKFSTQPSLCQNDHINSNHLSDNLLIEKLKRVLPGQEKPACNPFSQESYNIPSLALKSFNSNQQEVLLSNSFAISSIKSSQQPSPLNFQVDCMHLQRGLKDERIYYKKLLLEVNQIGRAIPNADLSCTQQLELKKKYLQGYLHSFFRQMGKQCYEKSLFIQRLWESTKQIFQTLIQKLVQELKNNEKSHLHESHSMHLRYQQKFQQFQTQISAKNQQVEKFKQIISKLSLKNWKKSKKNKQISQGIVQIVGKLDIAQKQRDYLQSEYVNMLTLGFQGGMDYEEAKKFTISKFSIEKEGNMKKKENKKISKSQQQIEQKQVSRKKQFKNKRKCGQKSMDPESIENKKQKLYKIKQKYIFGPNRNVAMPFQDDSDEQFYQSIGLKNFNCKVLKKCPQKVESSVGTIKLENGKDHNKQIKNYLNKRIQTVQLLGICSQPKIQKQCRQTNFGVLQKYRDNFIRNKEIQTEIIKAKGPNYYNCASQYNEEDFLNNFSWVDEIKQQNVIEESINIPGNEKSEEYAIKWMKLQKQKKDYKKRVSNIEQYHKYRLQKGQGQQSGERKLQNKEPSQQECQVKVEGKKMKNNNAMINKSTHYKKNNRPSLFKRNSSIVAEKRISLVDRVQKFQEIGIKNRREKVSDKNNYIQEQESQIYSKNSINSFKKPKQAEKSPIQSENYFLKSYIQMERCEQVQPDHQSDYYTTDMLSVIKNMSKLTPKGIYIDETMFFLLKKSLFKIKHDTCDNVFNQNYEFIVKARESVCGPKHIKNTTHVGGVKNFIKIIGSTYDAAFLRLYKKNKPNQQNFRSMKGQKEKKKVRNDSFKSTISKSHKRTQSNSSNIAISVLNLEGEEQMKINLVSLLRQSIKKQYPLYKTQQIENKIISLLKCISYQRNNNYQLKNFMLLSCLEENIFSSVIFDNDVQFYFALLLELNIGNCFDSFQQREDKQVSQKNYRLSNSIGSYQNCFTNIKKLKQCLPIFIKKHYKKEQLVTFIQHRISDTLQKIRGKQNSEMVQTTRLDIFKCSQLIMQSLFSFKLDILKSFAQLTELACLSPNNLISQQLLIDILGFIKMSKLEKLNTVNKFRYDYGKNNTIGGINLIYMVNFCIKHNLMDFDEILYDVLRRYPTNVEIQNKILSLQTTYTKFNKLQNICLYLHSKNHHYFANQNKLQSMNDQQPKDLTNQSLIQADIQPHEQNHIQELKNDTSPEVKNEVRNFASNCSHLDKQMWEIIGVKSSYCLIHCKVVELQSSQLLEYMLGDHMITVYMASLCLLQEKKCLINKPD